MTDPRDNEVEDLVARHLAALRGFVRLRMGPELRSREESCDIVQSVAREVLANSDRFAHGGEDGFREWLFTTAHRKIVNRLEHWRAEKRTARREQPIELPEELTGITATPSRNASRCSSLSEEQREAVTMSRFLGLSHHVIAERLGKTEVAVRKILSRGLARLAVALADGDESGAP